MIERKAIPPTKCDYMIRMHLRCIEGLSNYMKGGCKDGRAINSPMNVMVEAINLRKQLDEFIKEYEGKRVEDV